MRHRGILLLYCCILALTGCQQSALMQIKNENIAREQRIHEKEQQINDLETENRSLQSKKTELQKELETSKLNLDQLSERLKTLKLENDRIGTVTPEQLKKKEQFSRRLKEYRDEIEKLKNSDRSSSEERLSKIEKEKKIKELQEEIRLYLQFGLE